MQTWAMQRLAFDTEQAMPLHYITMEVSEMKYIVCAQYFFFDFFFQFLLSNIYYFYFFVNFYFLIFIIFIF